MCHLLFFGEMAHNVSQGLPRQLLGTLPGETLVDASFANLLRLKPFILEGHDSALPQLAIGAYAAPIVVIGNPSSGGVCTSCA